jgi:hypothetical protein
MARRNRLHREKLKRRKEIVEHPFGTMKRSMNQGYFLTRGLEMVRTETSLTVLAYNVKRLINILGVKRMVQPAPGDRARGLWPGPFFFLSGLLLAFYTGSRRVGQLFHLLLAGLPAA